MSRVWVPFLLLAHSLGICWSQPPRSPIVWFASWQHTGHIKALCPIAQELQGRGWEVRVAVHHEVTHQVPGDLSTVDVGDLPWNWSDEMHFRRVLWDPMPAPSPSEEEDGGKADLSERYFTGSQRSLAVGLNATLHKLEREAWPQLLVVDISSVGAMDLAEHLGLPFAVVSAWPVGPTLHSMADQSAFVHPWMPSELVVFPQSAEQQAFVDRLKRAAVTTLLPWFMEFAGFHAPRRTLRREFGLSGKLELLQIPPGPAPSPHPLVVILSHWGLDRPRPLPPHVQLVGPVEDYAAQTVNRTELSPEVQAWLSQVEGHVVYVSFGTNVQPKRRMVREMISSMAWLDSAGVRFLWDGEQADVEEHMAENTAAVASGNQLQSLPDNVLFAPRVDQLAVLASGNVSTFVTHCGLNSVQEALHFGVPLIGIPFLGDQVITSYLIVEAGVGVRLSVGGLSAPSFKKAVLSVLSEGHYRESAKRVGALGRLAGGARAAADALQAVLEHGAGHLQTIEDAHPGAARMWDVRALVLAVPLAVAAFLRWSWVVMAAAEGKSGVHRQWHDSSTSLRKKKKP